MKRHPYNTKVIFWMGATRLVLRATVNASSASSAVAHLIKKGIPFNPETVFISKTDATPYPFKIGGISLTHTAAGWTAWLNGHLVIITRRFGLWKAQDRYGNVIARQPTLFGAVSESSYRTAI